jgi:hypothetical protein
MLQYYLRAEGLALSWIGTGRIIFRLNYTEQDFEAVALCGGRQSHARRWLVVGRREIQATDQAPDPAGDDPPRAQ